MERTDRLLQAALEAKLVYAQASSPVAGERGATLSAPHHRKAIWVRTSWCLQSSHPFALPSVLIRCLGPRWRHV